MLVNEAHFSFVAFFSLSLVAVSLLSGSCLSAFILAPAAVPLLPSTFRQRVLRPG